MSESGKVKAEALSSKHGYWDVKPRLLVLLAASFACGTILSVAGIDKVFVAIMFVLIAALKVFEFESKILWIVALSAFLGIANAELRAPQADHTDISQWAGKVVTITGNVQDAKSLASGKGSRLLVKCDSVRECGGNLPDVKTGDHGTIQATVYTSRFSGAPQTGITPANCEPGDAVSIKGRIQQLPSTPRMEHLRLILARKKVFCQLNTQESNFHVLAHGCPAATNLIEDSAADWRHTLVDFHRKALGPDDGNLLASMVLGDRAASPGKEISSEFQACGLSHILAASGFNLSIVALSIYFLLRFCTWNLWIANSICFAGMLSFVAIAGPSPSVLRAFLMGSLLLLSRCLCRRLHMPAALCFTMLLVLIVDPWSAADVGFQLSYFSTAGMILAANRFCSILATGFKRVPEWLRTVIGATLVAQACVLPLQLYYFKQLTSYCLPANVVVSPMVAPLTVLGFAGSLVYMLESALRSGNLISVWLDRVCFYPLELLRWVVKEIASMPLAQIKTGQAQIAAVVLYYGVLLLFPWLIDKTRAKLWFLLYVLSLATLLGTMS